MQKLIKMLQAAHSGEIAAYHAYEGHWRSTGNLIEREAIRRIQAEEKEHIEYVEYLLEHLGKRPHVSYRDALYKRVGQSISALCYLAGRRFSAYGALAMERIGVREYGIMSQEALNCGLIEESEKLAEMGRKELEHQRFFEEILCTKEK